MPYKDPKKRKEQWKRWAINNRNNPERKLKNSIRAKTRYIYKKAENCSFENCKEKAERHHPDYSKPLEIIWLCNKHHDLLHKPAPKICSRDGCGKLHWAKGLCNAHYAYIPNKINRLRKATLDKNK